MRSLKSISFKTVVAVAFIAFAFSASSFAEDKDKNPPGWSKGQKEGWNGQNVPPGQGEKRVKPNIDFNHDGKVDQQEKQEAYEKYIKPNQEKRREKIKDRMDTNNDGKVDDTERAQAKEHWKEHHRDNDNNPPGPKGGPGSNWEKNDFKRHDRDNNPPGPAGGRGTNWENPAGPKGGPGASPNRRPKN